MKSLNKILIALAVVAVITSCSKLDETITEAPDVNTHNQGNIDPASPNFHGLIVSQSANGWVDCQQCHASDFSGGTTPVGCNTTACHPAINVHVEGIIDTNSQDFHGNFIRMNNWKLDECSQCHGKDYAGGIASPACITCHIQPEGPEACNTCHGNFNDENFIAPPQDTNNNTDTESAGVGAHQVHLYDNDLGNLIECTTCHVVPGSFEDDTHIDSSPGAEITFGNLAIHNIAVNPTYEHNIETCSDSYCHGNWEFLKDSSSNQFAYTSDKMTGDNRSVIWNQVDGSQAVCGSCHKLPPDGHIPADLSACGGCHTGIVDPDGNIIDKTKHINGEKNVFGN